MTIDPLTISGGPYEKDIQSALKEFDAHRFSRRLFDHDPSLWTTDPIQATKIVNRLGWIESGTVFLKKAAEIETFAGEIREAGFCHVVLLGMGGSSLCPEVCRRTFGPSPGWPELIVLDTTDPTAVEGIASNVDLAKTLFIVASKSGTTVETDCFYRYFWEEVTRATEGEPGRHFIAITDPGSPLAMEARERSFRGCFENPEDIGGRYSALSYFGLIPMALMGLDIRRLLLRSLEMREACGPAVPAADHPALSLGAALGILHRMGRNKVTFVLSEPIRTFGLWAEQLVAESTGKEGRGLLPVEGESLGEPEVYGPDRIFVHMYTDPEEDQRTRLLALQKAGHPLIAIHVEDRMNLGAEFLRWELATAAAASILGINPFDEPNVAESKENTGHLLKEFKERGRFAEEMPALQEEGVSVYIGGGGRSLGGFDGLTLRGFLNVFLREVAPPDYMALLPYFLQTEGREAILRGMRLSLRNSLKVATTIGYGPRYLHSTGQLHKGGMNRGVFLLFTAQRERDIAIPGQGYGFGTLQHAQALGDYRALVAKGRRVIRIHLGPDLEGGLRAVARCLEG